MDSKKTICLVIALMLAGCANGYKQFYKQAPGATNEAIASSRLSPPPSAPNVERMQPVDSQILFDAYGKRGFSAIGYSSFNSGSAEPDTNAVQQGQEVGADLVVILNPKYTGSVTSSIPIVTPTTSRSVTSGTATAYGSGGTVNAYGTATTTTYGTNTTYIPITINRADYTAVYFIKQRFSLGIFTRELSDNERQRMQSNKGVAVRLVVDDTPAYHADILLGDIIIDIDGTQITTPIMISELLRSKAGKMIEINFIRNGVKLSKSVQLK